MAGSPPEPRPPTLAAGSSSSPKPPPPPIYFTRHPSDEELMVSYLRPRVVSGTKLEVGFIHEADLYSADPDLLTSNPNYAAATASNGERAWYFFTPLRPKGTTKTVMKRDVDTGRKGVWVSDGRVKEVLSNGEVIGQNRLGFAFKEKVGGKHVKSAWRMMELRLNPNPNKGGQEEGSSELLALCKVYRISRNSKAADGSSMAVAKADGEATAASAVVTPGREGADEEIGADTAAGPARKKRKTGDDDSGAETVASSPQRQKKADGENESADATTTEQISADGKDVPLDAAEKAQQEEPKDPWDPIYDLFSDYYGDWW